MADDIVCVINNLQQKWLSEIRNELLEEREQVALISKSRGMACREKRDDTEQRCGCTMYSQTVISTKLWQLGANRKERF